MPLGSSAARSAIATSSEQTLLFPWDTPAVITSNDPTSLEVGLRFSADENGQLIGVRFWMPSQDTTPTITVRAWTSGGTSLASKSVTGFATGGWVRANFDTPIDLSAGTVYVVSRNIEQVGGITYVAARQNAFTNPVTVGDLTALGDGNNGVYSEAPGTFPTLSHERSSYFVDPIFRRSDAVAAAGDVDATIAVGTDTDSFPGTVTGTLGAQSVGTQTETDGVSSTASTLATGTDTGTLALGTESGSGTSSAGTGTDTLAPSDATGSETSALGTDSDSLAASSTPVATGYVASASGTGNWTNPTNAQGAPNATNAAITCAAGATASGTLAAASYTVGGAPASHTRTKVELIVTQQIDTTVGALSTCSCIINHKKSDGTGSFEVYRSETTAIGGTDIRNDASLQTNTYDITSAVSGWTDAEVLAAKTDFVAAANLLAVTGGNYTWNVDACALRVTYSRTGIT